MVRKPLKAWCCWIVNTVFGEGWYGATKQEICYNSTVHSQICTKLKIFDLSPSLKTLIGQYSPTVIAAPSGSRKSHFSILTTGPTASLMYVHEIGCKHLSHLHLQKKTVFVPLPHSNRKSVIMNSSAPTALIQSALQFHWLILAHLWWKGNKSLGFC